MYWTERTATFFCDLPGFESNRRMNAVKLNVAFLCIQLLTTACGHMDGGATSVVPPTVDSVEPRAAGSGTSVSGIHLTALSA